MLLLAGQTKRSSKKEEIGDAEIVRTYAQRLVKKLPCERVTSALAANVWPLTEVADQSGLSSLCRR